MFLVKCCILLTIILNLLNCLKANASDSLVVVTEDWPPYNYLLANKEIGGIATRKVSEVLDRAGIEYTLNLYPWARSYEMALKQKNVLIYSIYRNPNREHLFQWACPLLPAAKLYLFALSKNNDIHIAKVNDLEFYSIGIVRQEIASLYLQQRGFEEGKNLYVSANDNINLNLLLNGKIDIIVDTMASMKKRLGNVGQNFNLVKAMYLPDLNKATENCMAFSLNTSKDIVDKVRESLRESNGG